MDVHIGSQITELAPFEAAFESCDFIGVLEPMGAITRAIWAGFGRPLPARQPAAADPDAYGKVIAAVTNGLDVQLIFEPGRLI